MSRGPGPHQLALLARVKRLKPGEQFLLTDLAGRQIPDDEWGSWRRSARILEAKGQLRLDGKGRGLVVRPGLDPRIPDTYRVRETPVSDAYRRSPTPDTSGQSKRPNGGVSVGPDRGEVVALLEIAELATRVPGLTSAADREFVARLGRRLRGIRA